MTLDHLASALISSTWLQVNQKHSKARVSMVLRYGRYKYKALVLLCPPSFVVLGPTFVPAHHGYISYYATIALSCKSFGAYLSVEPGDFGRMHHVCSVISARRKPSTKIR